MMRLGQKDIYDEARVVKIEHNLQDRYMVSLKKAGIG